MACQYPGSSRIRTGVLEDVVATLTRSAMPISGDFAHVPRRGGLYAFHSSPAGWSDLGLPMNQGHLVYVGKSERGLLARNVMTHFETGKTGQSTLRRSLAALLREQLDLHGVPRNLDKPGYYANFGLRSDGDERLSRWMSDHLTLGVWPLPEAGEPLKDIEDAVIDRLQPPLNIRGVERRSDVLKLGREALKEEARAWVGFPR